MIDELTEMDELVLSGAKGPDTSDMADREREIMRSILISNETYVKSSFIESSGDIYLDVVAAVKHGLREVSAFQISVRVRRDIIARMRAVLRKRSGSVYAVGYNPLKAAYIGALGGTLVALWWLWITGPSVPRYLEPSPLVLAWRSLPVILGGAVVGGLTAFGVVVGLEILQMRRWRRVAERLRLASEVASVADGSLERFR
jgi:hypothetical protein